MKWGLCLLLFAWLGNSNNELSTKEFYNQLSIIHSKPSYKVFELAMTGYEKLLDSQKLKNKDVLTVIDFDKSSAERRLWVINLTEKRVIHESLVAHGKNTGNVFATSFSNKKGSLQSSLGFYTTGDTYIGKHGLSLYLDGMEKGINDMARERSIVIHGAHYVSREFIKKYGRLGRSFGCPALPQKKHKDIIEYIKGGSCLFIYQSNKTYLQNSQFLTEGAP